MANEKERWVAADLDNTICLLGTAIRREVKRLFDIDITPHPDFNAYRDWARHGVTEEQLEAVFKDGEVFRSLGIRSGALNALGDLQRAGYKIAIVTDRFWHDKIAIDTYRWLCAADVPFDELALVKAEEKADWVKNHTTRDFRVFFEDRLDTAIELSAVVPEVGLFDYPWNRTTETTPTNVRRITSWAVWQHTWPGWKDANLDRFALGARKPFVIAVAGLAGCGKDTLHVLLRERGFKSYSYADLLREEARRQDIAYPSRQELIALGEQLRRKFGATILSKLLSHKIATESTPLAVVGSVRHPAEIAALRADSRFDTLVVGIEARREERLRRVLARARAGDPRNEFEFDATDARDLGDRDLSSTKTQVGLTLEQADEILDGSGTIQDFEAQLNTLLARYVPDIELLKASGTSIELV